MNKWKGGTATFLTCISAVGVVMTAISAANDTPRAMKLLEIEEDEKGRGLTTEERVKTAAPAYIPTAAIAASTILCIFGSNVLNKRQQATLASAYALLDRYHRSYRNELIKRHGKKADEEIQRAIARSSCNYHKIGIDAPDVLTTFYDEISGESITCYERELMDAEYHLNRNFVLRGYASLNEFYSFLGLPQTDYGAEVGWTITDGYGFIDFEHHLISRDDGGPDIYSINMVIQPDPDYMQEWE